MRKPKSKHEEKHPLGTNVGGCFGLFYDTATAVSQHSKYFLSIPTLFLNVLSDLFKYSITFEIRLHTKVYRIVYLCTHITYIISFLFSWHFLIFCLFSLSFPLGKLVPQYNLMYTVFLCVAVSFALLHILMLKHLIRSLECCPVT